MVSFLNCLKIVYKVIDQSKCFSSGPCKKFPFWSRDVFENALIGRSHRAGTSIERICLLIKLLREVLDIPSSYHVSLTPGSITGSIELGLWSLMSEKDVTCLAFDPFGYIWHNDIKDVLGVKNVTLIDGQFGKIPDLNNCNIDFSNDLFFVHAATTTAVTIPDFDWIPESRSGLVFADAAASAFCMPLDWAKFDVVSFGFQKGLGCEANQGVIVLSPAAMDRFLSAKVLRPRPRLLRMTKEMFGGYTINTPSMLCIEEYISVLSKVLDLGGAGYLYAICTANKSAVDNWLSGQDYFAHLCKNTRHQSVMNSCLVFKDRETNWDLVRPICERLVKEGFGYDVLGHTSAVPCIRIWHGGSVDEQDLLKFLDNLTNIMEQI